MDIIKQCNEMQCMKYICTPKLKSDIVLNVNTICKIKRQHKNYEKAYYVLRIETLDKKQVKETYECSLGLRYMNFYIKKPIL